VKRLSQDALQVLGSMNTDGNTAFLPERQLNRKLYVEVNAALEALGGKWNRKSKGHVFQDDPEEAITQVVNNGGFVDKKQELGFFQTPEIIAQELVNWLNIKEGEKVLEPSAGQGRIADQLRKHTDQLFCVEIDPKNVAVLREKGHATHQGDFLSMDISVLFDAIAMNPPFGKQADIDHVMHALKFLKPGGKLAAIMSAGVRFRSNKKTLAFRQLVEECGEIQDHPSDSFRAEGTGVSTVAVLLTKPKI
jgi:predicted RNA methylase